MNRVADLAMSGPTKPRRRWLSYSLRTLFVLVTLLCVWLGLYANRAERQKRAVAWAARYITTMNIPGSLPSQTST